MSEQNNDMKPRVEGVGGRRSWRAWGTDYTDAIRALSSQDTLPMEETRHTKHKKLPYSWYTKDTQALSIHKVFTPQSVRAQKHQ